MDGLRVLQIYQNVNMNVCKGESSIRDFIARRHRGIANYRESDRFIMINKANNILKAFNPFDGSMFVEKKHGKETWDWGLRKDEIFTKIGANWGLKWNVSEKVFEPIRKGMRNGGEKQETKAA